MSKTLLRVPFAVLAAVLLTACGRDDSGPDPAAAAVDTDEAAESLLVNGDFDSGELDPWGTAVHADPMSFEIDLDDSRAQRGARSVRVHSKGSEPWGGITQLVDARNLAGARLRLRAWVHGEGVAEALELMVVFRSMRVLDPIQYRSEHLSGNFDWQPVEVEFEVPAGVQQVEIGFIHNGPGTTWIDNASLVRLPD